MPRFTAPDNKLLSRITEYLFPGNAHGRVNDGVLFQSHVFRGEGDTVADNGTIEMGVSTNGNPLHFVYIVACSGDVEIELIEGASTIVASTLVSNCRNRANASTTTALTFVASTVTAGGLQIEHFWQGGGSGKKSSGGGSDPLSVGWILAPSTTYLVRATNRSGGAAEMNIAAVWYDEKDV